MKNLFAAIGFVVVLKKAIELYSEYTELKRESETHRATPDATTNN